MLTNSRFHEATQTSLSCTSWLPNPLIAAYTNQKVPASQVSVLHWNRPLSAAARYLASYRADRQTALLVSAADRQTALLGSSADRQTALHQYVAGADDAVRDPVGNVEEDEGEREDDARQAVDATDAVRLTGAPVASPHRLVVGAAREAVAQHRAAALARPRLDEAGVEAQPRHGRRPGRLVVAQPAAGALHGPRVVRLHGQLHMGLHIITVPI